MTDVTEDGVVVERTDEQSAIVAVEVEFDLPYYTLTEDETETPGIAETCAYITALGNLWIALRSVGYDAGELLESIEARYQDPDEAPYVKPFYKRVEVDLNKPLDAFTRFNSPLPPKTKTA